MDKIKEYNWLQIIGAILILIGTGSIFLKNDTWLHTSFQINFVLGCIIFIVGGRSKRNGNLPAKD